MAVIAFHSRTLQCAGLEQGGSGMRTETEQGAQFKNSEITENRARITGVPRGWFGGFKPPPPRNSEVLKKLGQIPSSVEYTSVTT
jgi:hypothetical protein